MEKMNLCEGVMARMMEDEAWKKLSGIFPFSEEQLERYADKVDWEAVSENSQIFWTVPMLEKFRHRVHWDLLARNFNPDVMSEDIPGRFKDYWDWDEFSENTYLTEAMIGKYADLLNWKKVINNWAIDIDRINPTRLVEKYQDRIPTSEFRDSRLCGELVSEKVNDIKRRICLNQQ